MLTFDNIAVKQPSQKSSKTVPCQSPTILGVLLWQCAKIGKTLVLGYCLETCGSAHKFHRPAAILMVAEFHDEQATKIVLYHSRSRGTSDEFVHIGEEMKDFKPYYGRASKDFVAYRFHRVIRKPGNG